MLRLARIARLALFPAVAVAQTPDHHDSASRVIAAAPALPALSQADVRQFNIATLVLAHARALRLDETQRRELTRIASTAQRTIDSLYAQIEPAAGNGSRQGSRQHVLNALAALEVETETVSGLAAGVLRDSQYPAAAALCDARYADLAAMLERAGF